MRITKLCNPGFILSFLIFVLPAGADSSPEVNNQYNGSSGIRVNRSDSIVRVVNYSEIDFQPYYADRSLHYGREPVQVRGFWNRWLLRISKMLGTVLSQKATGILLYLGVFFICAYLLIRFLRGEAESVWQSNKENLLLFNEEGTQITVTDLAALLQEEISSGNYNKAVRILFLQTIQHLANQGLISLHQEKTNSDFLHEINDVRIRDQFRELTRIYEFSWYGNQALNQSYFDRIASRFHLFNNQFNEK